MIVRVPDCGANYNQHRPMTTTLVTRDDAGRGGFVWRRSDAGLADEDLGAGDIDLGLVRGAGGSVVRILSGAQGSGAGSDRGAEVRIVEFPPYRCAIRVGNTFLRQ